jgi:hypothetical protein
MHPLAELVTIQSWPVFTAGLKESPAATVPSGVPPPLDAMYQTWMSASLSLLNENPTPEPPAAEPIEPSAAQPWEVAPE